MVLLQTVDVKPASMVGTPTHMSHLGSFSAASRGPLEPPKMSKPWSLSCLRPAPPLKPSAALGYKEVRAAQTSPLWFPVTSRPWRETRPAVCRLAHLQEVPFLNLPTCGPFWASGLFSNMHANNKQTNFNCRELRRENWNIDGCCVSEHQTCQDKEKGLSGLSQNNAIYNQARGCRFCGGAPAELSVVTGTILKLAQVVFYVAG